MTFISPIWEVVICLVHLLPHLLIIRVLQLVRQMIQALIIQDQLVQVLFIYSLLKMRCIRPLPSPQH